MSEVMSDLEAARQRAADQIISVLARQPGIDVVPAGAGRFLSAVYLKTGFKFSCVGHGRHHDVFDIMDQSGNWPGIVLKLGNRPSVLAEVQFATDYPDDWAHVYASFDYGLVCERVGFIGPDDLQAKSENFVRRTAELAQRYASATLADIGLVGDRVVITGSSQRLRPAGKS